MSQDKKSKSKKLINTNSNYLINKWDKDLVTEQNGMKVFVFGLIFSIVSGIFIKSALSPNRIAQSIQRASGHIHKNLKVKFKEAKFSLNHGILPRLAVVISDVELDYQDPCSFSSVLNVDELRLPISLWGLMTGKPVIKKIEAESAILNVNDEKTNCEVKKLPVAVNTSDDNLVTLTPREEALKYPDVVDEIDINNLKIFLKTYPQYPFEIMDLNLKVSNFEPKVIQVRAKTHLLHDEQVGGYLSYANLFAEYKEVPEPEIQTHIFGNWREGHYSVIANFNIHDRFLNIETDVKHIPISQILSLFQKYKLAPNDLKLKQEWVSGVGHIAGEVQSFKKTPLEIRNFQIEGEMGQISSNQINLTSLEPLKFKPIELELKNFDVNNFVTFLSRNPTTKILGDLGIFTGQVEIQSEKSIRLIGEHKGLEFIFSNKGQREYQVIDSMIGEASLNNNQWLISLKKIEPHDGQLIGYVNLKSDLKLKDISISAKIENLTLSPEIQKLMTNGGEIGLMSAQGDCRFRDMKLKSLRGSLAVSRMNLEGMDFEKAAGDAFLIEDNFIFKTKVGKVIISPDSAGEAVLKKFVPSHWWQNSSLNIQDLNGQFQWSDLSQFQWKNFQAKVGDNKRIALSGGWNEFGQLNGLATLREGKLNKRFELTGDRDNPLLKPIAPGGTP